jgi:hypothetical protein
MKLSMDQVLHAAGCLPAPSVCTWRDDRQDTLKSPRIYKTEKPQVTRSNVNVI